MARVRAARHYQRRDAAVRRIADAGKRQTRPSIKAALKALPGMLDVRAATAMFAHGRHREVAHNAVDWHHFKQVLRHPFERLARVYEEGAALAQRKINGAFASRGRRVRYRKVGPRASLAEDARTQGGTKGEDVQVRGTPGPTNGLTALERFGKASPNVYAFDRFDQETQRWLRYQQDELIRELEADVRDVIEMMVQRGVRMGWDAEQIAGQLREVISLTDRQAGAVLNYRSMLEGLDRDALGRQLRDVEFDAAVRSAIEEGVPLGEAEIDEMVAAYADNYLDYRADLIAETETTRMANTGLQQSYEQAIDRGVFPAEAVKQYWQIALDEHTCPICESIPDANPDGVAMGEDFDSDDGPQDVPPVHPGCRCSIEIVTDLDLVPDTQEEEAA